MNIHGLSEALPANHTAYPGVTSSDITTEEWLTYWQKLRIRGLEPTSAQRVRYVVRLINAELGSVPLQCLSYLHIQSCIDAMVEKSISLRTVRSAFLYFSEALDIAKQRKLLGYNPCASMQLPSISNPIREVYSPDELIPLFEAAKGTELENMIPVAMYAALRAGEALALSWRQIDFQRKCILIDQSYREYYNEENQKIKEIRQNTKSGRHRIIYPPECTFEYLAHQRLLQEKRAHSSDQSGPIPDGLLQSGHNVLRGERCGEE